MNSRRPIREGNFNFNFRPGFRHGATLLMSFAERGKMPRARSLMARAVLTKFLMGQEGISFRVAFLSFDALTHPNEDPGPPKSVTSTTTSTTDLPDETPIPASVFVLHRKKDISNYRRRGTRVILGKLLGIMDCATWEETQSVWESRHSEGDPELLRTVETLEKEIFQCSDDLSDYENLLLNFIMHTSSQKRLGEVRSSVRNASSQTGDSFLSGRQNTVEELLKKQQKDFTEEEWTVLLEQNRELVSGARSQWSLSLRHSFTQTLASLHSGLKCVESDSSPEFSWLELAPNLIRFFPVFPVVTQTTEDDRKKTSETQLVWSGMVQRLPVNLTSFFQFYLPNMGPEEEPLDHVAAKLLPNGVGVDLKDMSVGVQIGRLLRVLDEIIPTRCLTHKGPQPIPGCLPCKAALWMPPPWAHPLFALIYEAHGGKRFLSRNERLTACVMEQFNDMEHYEIQRSRSRELVLIHLVRKFHFCSLQLQLKNPEDKRERDRENKKLKETLLKCACKPSQQGSQYGIIPGQSSLVKMGFSHSNNSHYCLFCGVQEQELGDKFQVCWECRQQRLITKALYCSTDCLLKHRHKHRKLHDALAPGRIDVHDLFTRIMFPTKQK